MTRAEIDEFVVESGFENVVVFDNPGYENAFIGVSTDGRAIYDYQKMIECFVSESGCTDEEAIEFIDYNTIRALPYYGECAPIVVYKYGD